MRIAQRGRRRVTDAKWSIANAQRVVQCVGKEKSRGPLSRRTVAVYAELHRPDFADNWRATRRLVPRITRQKKKKDGSKKDAGGSLKETKTAVARLINHLQFNSVAQPITRETPTHPSESFLFFS